MDHILENLSDYVSIFLLMLSTFLIGYFSAWNFQKSKYTKLLKKAKRQANLNKINKDVSNIETIFTEIKPKIVEVVKETQKQQQKYQETNSNEQIVSKSPEDIVAQTRMSYVTYTKSKPELNFDHFGHGNPQKKDDLTQINGIGPYIEQRLNEIGIYNYDQISRFQEEDIMVLTELIDFFPGRIERDNWIFQAEALKIH